MSAKVLVAHGNTQRLRLAVEILQSAGFDVIATPDGGDAFARFFEEMPDLVICNVSLPSLSGPNLARMVLSQSPGTPVVILIDQPLDETIEGATLMTDPLEIEALRRELPEVVPTPTDSSEPVIAAASSAEVFVHAALKRFQRDNSLLALLDDAGITELSRIAVHQVCTDGELVVKEGDPGHGFYFVVEGQVRVTLEEQDGAEVARINPGGFFGEMSLLNDEPRSASVWTVGATTLLWFDRDSFMPMLDRFPAIREVLSGVALKRTEENLWRVLFDDDEVQRTIGGIADDADAIAEMVVEHEPDTTSGGLETPEATPSEGAITPTSAVTPPSTSGADDFDLSSQLGTELNAELAEIARHPNEPALSSPADAEPANGAAAAGGSGPELTVPTSPSPSPTANTEAELERTSDRPTARSPDPAAARAVAQAAFTALVSTPTPTSPVSLQEEPIVADDPAAEPVTEVPLAEVPEPAEPVVATTPRPLARRFASLITSQIGVGFGAGLAVGLLFTAISLLGEDGSNKSTRDLDDPANLRSAASEGRTPKPEIAKPELPDTPGEPPKPPGSADGSTEEDGAEEAEEATATTPSAAEPREARTPKELAERKRLRRWLLNSFKNGNFQEAVRIGNELRMIFVIDWEAEFTIAQAERLNGQQERAITSYERFFATYPDNFRADDARYHAAVLYAEAGNKSRARALFKKVAADQSSDLRAKAAAWLRR